MNKTSIYVYRFLMSSLLVLLSAAMVAGASTPKRGHTKLSARARQEATARGAAGVDVIVRFRRVPGDSERAAVRQLGGRVRHEHRRSRWLSLRLPGRAVTALADNPNVEFVAFDAPVFAAMDVALEAVDYPPATQPESSLTGSGVTIAMLDSGVASNPDIQTLVAAVDLVGGVQPASAPSDPANTSDGDGHGTHVAGILVGNGSRSPQGNVHGVAPGANLVSVRVLDSVGSGRTSDVMVGLQWVIDHKDEYGIRVVNLSLGHPIYEPAASDPLVQAVDEVWDAGIVVVCSAGNSGRSGHGTISSPCNSRKVITVGAFNDRGTPESADDAVATFSSRGPTLLDRVAKPDILAPGSRIVSIRAPGSYLDSQSPDQRVAADPGQPEVIDYFQMSGTSMAAPHVSGAAALMLQQEPSLNPATVKARLMLSARKASVGDPFSSGAGALDVLAALRTGGQVQSAPSPLVWPDPDTGALLFENTGALWANPAFSLQAI